MSSAFNHNRRPTVALDFDGVIHRYSKGWQDGTAYDRPMDGTGPALAKLHQLGYAVCIYSTRDPQVMVDWFAEHLPEFNLQIAHDWEKFWNDPDVIGVFKHKPVATVYIDDRAVRFFHWEQALIEAQVHIDKECGGHQPV